MAENKNWETTMLGRYEGYLARLVHRFMYKARMSYARHWEDMLQEARMAFVAHLRRAPSEQHVFLCKIHVWAALQRYREQAGVVCLPRDQYKKYAHLYKAVRCEACFTVPYTDDYADDQLSEILIRQFTRTLSDQERVALDMRLSGYKFREIQCRLKLSTPTQAKRVLTTVGKKLHKLIGDGDIS